MMFSLRKIRAVWQREFLAEAASPTAWVFLVIFLELSAFLTFIMSGLFSYGQADLSPFFEWFPWLFLFIIPALGMPLWSEERKTGSFELSLSFPVTLWELALGKFLAGMTLLLIALLLTVSVPLTALYLGRPDPGAIVCGYFGALLLGAVYLAVSCFCSALSKSQTASFLFSLVICAVFMTIGLPVVLDMGLLFLPEWLVSVFSYLAFLPHYTAFQRGFVDSADVVYCISLTLFFLCLTTFSLEFAASGTGNIFAPGALREASTKKAFRRLALRIVLSFYALICLNLIGSTFQLRWDMSSDGAYSLSGEAKNFASALKSSATLRFYASKSSPRMPESMKKYAERVEWLLRDLCAASRGKLTLHVLDPEPDSEDEEAAFLEGLKPFQLNTGDRFYLGLSVSNADRCIALPQLALQQENLLEYDVVRAILNVTAEKRPVIGIMSALPVTGTPVNLGLQQYDKDKPAVFEHPWYIVNELSRNYNVVKIPLDTAAIENVDALLVIHPAGIQERAVYALDQYLMRGGKMAVFLDPRSFYSMIKLKNDYSYMEKISSTLEPLTTAWGVSFNPNLVAADMIYSYRKVLPERIVSNPVAMNISGEGISRGLPLTSSLNLLELWFSAGVEAAPPPGMTAETLLSTSNDSQMVSAYVAERPELILKNFKASGEKIPLGIRLSGRFPSAFPKGAPIVSGEPHLNESVKETEVFLFGDSDMLFNDLCVRSVRDAYGQNNIVRLNDNIALLEGIVEQMTSAGGWLSRIRSRVPMSRPLTKVNEIKARAELAYKSRILALERDLRESQERVQAIRNQMSSGSKDGLTAEQKAELKEYSFKNSQVRRELKEVRRQLRADMNRIDTILRVVNLLVVPGLVILAGLLWSFFRFSKWRRKK